jgi:hypothetical protein
MPSSVRLSPSEIAQRHKGGKCFKCDELFTPDHRKHCKQLFTIEIMDEEEANGLHPMTEEPTISLHALTGIQPRTSRTMALMVDANGTRLLTLFNFSSTHNFIDNAAASRACVILAAWHDLCITVTNGDKLPPSGCCRKMAISVHDENFPIDCFGLPLGSYDMVLGVQWMESLGPILWDFRRGTLAFVRNNHWVNWSAAAAGSTPTPPPLLLAMDSELMDELLQEFTPLFQEPTRLPPARSRAHRIHLLPDTAPIAVRQYRYAHA